MVNFFCHVSRFYIRSTGDNDKKYDRCWLDLKTYTANG
jgi:hypothetical protein